MRLSINEYTEMMRQASDLIRDYDDAAKAVLEARRLEAHGLCGPDNPSLGYALEQLRKVRERQKEGS